MKGRLRLLAAALGWLMAVYLHPVCSVGFGGETLAGDYSPSAVRCAMTAADRAAEELLPGAGVPPRPLLRWSVSLRPPQGDGRRVADAALRATEGLCVADGVFLNGLQFGLVTNGARLAGRLQARLYDGMPHGALYRLLLPVTSAWYADADGRILG